MKIVFDNAHFHMSHSEQIDGCLFRAIDELEFYQIPYKQ